ncbi:MAG: adenosylcobinamide-GDP ribazoletransferase, partial [Desulfovibrionaceae bacterium]
LPLLLPALARHPGPAAWLLVAGLAWLTRGLHLDGLADVLDGSAAHAEPERFWRIVKDSHIGAFGVIGMVLALLGQATLLTDCLGRHLYGALPFALAAGRCAAVVLACLRRSLARPGLGGLFLAQATPGRTILVSAATLAAGLLLTSPAATALAALLAAAPLAALARLATRVQGCNGDFLGAAITTAELTTLLAITLAG